jgi:ATP-binding cassette subfamily B (MDR/TAP) protein 1
LHYAAVFVSGICVSFGTIWQLTAVTLSVLPLLAAAGGAYLAIRVGQTKWSQEAYSKAGGIAEEVLKLQRFTETNCVVQQSALLSLVQI